MHGQEIYWTFEWTKCEVSTPQSSYCILITTYIQRDYMNLKEDKIEALSKGNVKWSEWSFWISFIWAGLGEAQALL